MQEKKYRYANCPIPGGGYVTGFLFGNVDRKAQYIRTDIGGTYRYDRKSNSFVSLIDSVSATDLSPTYVAAIATNDKVNGSLYVACGLDNVGANGELLVSKDYGETFLVKRMPAMAHGNKNGRGTGKRLWVDSNTNEIFFASYEDGLLITEDEGDTWSKLSVCGETHLTGLYLVENTNTLIVATAGIETKESDKKRGHSLYISYDRGKSFEKMSMPEINESAHSKMSGLVGHRISFDGKYLYVTCNQTGERAYIVEPGYSCDCGHVVDGVVLRYHFLEDGKISDYEEISPKKEEPDTLYGFGAVGVSRNTKGLLVLSTLTRNHADIVYRSFDYGNTWEKVLEGLDTGKITFKTPYMQPEYNGNASLLHWLSDIEINPFDDNEVWFNSGTGVFRTTNFLDHVVNFTDECVGIEETVHLNVYAPLDGEVKLIDIVGDLGGFAFRDLDMPCNNSFADSEGNRYITCINADFSDEDVNTAVITARGNWTGKTKGGLIYTTDNFKTFTRKKLPFGISQKLDNAFKILENPNVNAGWVAMSMDCRNIVWSVADMIFLPIDMVIVSHDFGESFSKVKVNDLTGEKMLKVFSDRVNSSVFYGFSDIGTMFISTDAGDTFNKIDTPKELAGVHFGLIDTADKTSIKVEPGKEGVIYIATGKAGLWKFDNGSFSRLSKEGDEVYRIGLGINKGNESFLSSNKAIYAVAVIDGKYGFYRSLDDFETLERINNENQMFGEINSIDADKRFFGRFFLATGSRGVLYAQED